MSLLGWCWCVVLEKKKLNSPNHYMIEQWEINNKVESGRSRPRHTRYWIIVLKWEIKTGCIWPKPTALPIPTELPRMLSRASMTKNMFSAEWGERRGHPHDIVYFFFVLPWGFIPDGRFINTIFPIFWQTKKKGLNPMFGKRQNSPPPHDIIFNQ